VRDGRDVHHAAGDAACKDGEMQAEVCYDGRCDAGEEQEVREEGAAPGGAGGVIYSRAWAWFRGMVQRDGLRGGAGAEQAGGALRRAQGHLSISMSVHIMKQIQPMTKERSNTCAATC
jgi:hypothetical protein